MNLTFNIYCSGNSGVLKRVIDKPSSLLVKVGAIDYLYEKNVQFVEWQLNDKYSRSKNFSQDLPEGLYKAFLRPTGDKDCDSIKVFFPDSEVRKRIYNRIKYKPLDKCVVIVKIDSLMAKYQNGNTTYTEKTHYGYSVRVTDRFITDLFMNKKVGLYRNISVSWAIPFVSYILGKSEHFHGGYKTSCGQRMWPPYFYWQDLFQFEEDVG